MAMYEAITPVQPDAARVSHVIVSKASNGARSGRKLAPVVAVIAGAAMLVALVALTAFRPTGSPQQLASSSCIGPACGNYHKPANLFFGPAPETAAASHVLLMSVLSCMHAVQPPGSFSITMLTTPGYGVRRCNAH